MKLSIRSILNGMLGLAIVCMLGFSASSATQGQPLLASVLFALGVLFAVGLWWLDREIHSLRSLSALNLIIHNESDLDRVTESLCRTVLQELRASTACVLRDREAGDCTAESLSFSDSVWQRSRGRAHRLEELPATLSRNAEEATASDVTDTALADCGRFGALRRGQDDAIMVIHLTHQKRHYGKLMVQRRARSARFRPAEVALLEDLADQLAASFHRQQLLSDIKYQAEHDALTGLPNRAAFEVQLREHIACHGARTGFQCSVMFIDLDGFKHINDTHGHAEGDRVLCEVGQRFHDTVAGNDVIARIGGDEFAVLLREIESHQQAVEVARRITECLGPSFTDDAHKLGASIGISHYPTHGTDTADLIRYADMAMYYAKSRGSNHIEEFSTELAVANQARMTLESDLVLSVERGELELHYQPQVDAISGRVVGAEALIRWNHPDRGRISPMIFIPMAEQLGTIIDIGDWAIRESCRQIAAWRDAGLADFRVAINISSRQFTSPSFVVSLLSAMSHFEVPARLIELELTESLMMHDIASVVERLQVLRDAGVQIAIDDFGTGYSSLQYLDDLPLDILKIDRAFIRRLSDENAEHSLAESITAMAKSLGLKTVAEGVEDDRQLRRAIEIGCDVIQGYYYSAPVTAEELPEVVARLDRAHARRAA